MGPAMAYILNERFRAIIETDRFRGTLVTETQKKSKTSFEMDISVESLLGRTQWTHNYEWTNYNYVRTKRNFTLFSWCYLLAASGAYFHTLFWVRTIFIVSTIFFYSDCFTSYTNFLCMFYMADVVDDVEHSSHRLIFVFPKWTIAKSDGQQIKKKSTKYNGFTGEHA